MVFSFFNTNKHSLILLLSACVLFASLPMIQSKEASNLRSNMDQMKQIRLLSSTDSSDTDEGCWLQSYGRGVGKPVNTCADGLEEDAGLCYPPCQAGYYGVGPVCWQSCPSGFKDTGVDCLKPSSYGRGTGYAAWHEDKCKQENPQGCQKYGAMWYPDCADGFSNFGCCVCSPTCPSGMTDIGVSCQKKSYGRGVGKPMYCAANQDEDAGLCYQKCKSGYNGVGPVCWGSCPSGMYQCGALCLESEAACVGDMLQIADEVLEAISESESDDESMTVAETGVNIGQQLASYPMCSNM